MNKNVLMGIAAFVVVGLVVVGVTFGPATFEYWALRKFLARHHADARARMVPTERVFVSAPPVAPINIGYAVLDISLTGPVELQARGPNIVSVLHPDFHVSVWRPFDRKSMGATYDEDDIQQLEGTPHSVARFALTFVTDPIAAYWKTESTIPLPFFSYLKLPAEDRQLHVFLISEKAAVSVGQNELYKFTSDDIYGIAWIGEERDDRRNAYVLLGCRHADRNVYVLIAVLDHATIDIAQPLESILASFRFTSDVDDQQKVRQLIEDAKVPFVDP